MSGGWVLTFKRWQRTTAQGFSISAPKCRRDQAIPCGFDAVPHPGAGLPTLEAERRRHPHIARAFTRAAKRSTHRFLTTRSRHDCRRAALDAAILFLVRVRFRLPADAGTSRTSLLSRDRTPEPVPIDQALMAERASSRTNEPDGYLPWAAANMLASGRTAKFWSGGDGIEPPSPDWSSGASP